VNKTYETIFIVDAILDDEKIESIIQKYSSFLIKNEGSIVNIDKWGRRKFAYQIKKKHTGYYISIEFTGNSSAVAKLERQYHLDDNILRYLTVSFDKRTLTERKGYFEKKAQFEAEYREREAAHQAEALKNTEQTEAPGELTGQSESSNTNLNTPKKGGQASEA
jgi:small subunit ribosomal protein S6